MLAIFIIAKPGHGQENPVYVNESPRGAELLRRAASQAEANPREAARLYQEVLDDAWQQLAPLGSRHPDQFLSLRNLALEGLLAEPIVLERYQQTQSGQAQRELDAGSLELVAIRRPMTSAGLEAMLRLAESAIDHGAFDSARYWLDQSESHPNQTDRTIRHAAYLLGVAARFQSDTEVLENVIEKLQTDPEATPLRNALINLKNEPLKQSVSISSSPLEQNTSGDMNALVGMPMWSFPLIESLYQRRKGTSNRRSNERQKIQTNTVAPTVHGELVLINQGTIIQALNRFNGEEVWRFRNDSNRSIASASDAPLDLNAIAVEGSSLVTYTGHAHARVRSNPSNIICLDTQTGAFKWWVNLELLSPSETFDGLFPIGAPLIKEGTVYVLARKVSRQYLASCFIVALELNSGVLKWSSYIGSSGSLRNRSAWPASLLTYDNGTLFVASPVGVIASLSATTGQINWLHRSEVPVSQGTSITGMVPWNMAQPIVAGDRIIALSPDRNWVFEFDRLSGDLIQTKGALVSSSLAEPQYLLANDDRLYSVGKNVRAFSIDDYNKPLWQYPPRGPFIDNPVVLTGRVVLADDALVIPTSAGIAILDPTTGDEIQLVNHALSGHPLVVDSQLLIATDDAVHSYLSDAQAELLLRRSLARSPENPKPAIMLVQLGYRTNRLELMEEATALALKAITIAGLYNERLSDQAQDQLTTVLLEIAAGNALKTGDTEPPTPEILANLEVARATAFRLLSTVIQSASQRVAFALAYGDWLKFDDPAAAVDSYASILRDPDLRRQWVWDRDVGRRGGSWATALLNNLIVSSGPEIRSILQERADKDPAADISNLTSMTPASLIKLARAFPFSQQGVQASMRASQLLIEQGAPRRAIGLLMLIGRSAKPADQTLIAAQALKLSQAMGWTELATMLQSDTQYVWNGGAYPTDGSIATTTSNELPEIGDVTPSTSASVLNGSIVAQDKNIFTESQNSLALLEQDNRIGLFDSTKKKMRWWVDKPASFSTDSSLSVLGITSSSSLLWESGEQPSAVLLSNETGLPIWKTAPLNGIFGGVVNLQRRSSTRLQHRSRDDRFDEKAMLPLVGKNDLMILQRSGQAVSLSLESGDHLWKTKDLLQHLLFAQRSSWGVTLVGDGPRPLTTEYPWSGRTWLVLVDSKTGHKFGEISLPNRETPLWVESANASQVLIGAAEGIACVDIVTGDLLWFNRSPLAQSTTSASAVNRNAFAVFDSNRDLRMINLHTAQLSDSLQAPANRDWTSQDVIYSTARNGILYTMTQDRIIAFAGDGQVVGADFIADPRGFEAILQSRNGFIIPSLRPKNSNLRQAGLRIREANTRDYTYQFFQLTPDCRITDSFELPPLPTQGEYAIPIQGAVLFSTNKQTIVIDLPATQQ